MLFQPKFSKYFLLSNLSIFVSLASILKYCTIENEFIKALINGLISHNDTTMTIFLNVSFFDSHTFRFTVYPSGYLKPCFKYFRNIFLAVAVFIVLIGFSFYQKQKVLANQYTSVNHKSETSDKYVLAYTNQLCVST